MVSINRDALTEKILAGERISADDALELYGWPLEELGVLASARRDLAKAKSYGGRGREIVTYIVDRNINYTNVCNVYCKFCAFYRTERDEDHYVLTYEQIDQKLDEVSAHQYSRVQSARVPAFRRNFPDAAAGRDFRIQKRRARFDPWWRRRNSG